MSGAAPQDPALPRNPAFGFAWALAWLLVSVLGFVVLFTDTARILSGEQYGQRTMGFLLITPFLTLAIGVAVLVRAFVGVPARQRYVASTTLQERRAALDAELRDEVVGGPLTLGVVVGVAWFAFLVILLLHLPQVARTTPSLFTALVVLCLTAMVWVSVLILALRRLAARRRAPTTL